MHLLLGLETLLEGVKLGSESLLWGHLGSHVLLLVLQREGWHGGLLYVVVAAVVVGKSRCVHGLLEGGEGGRTVVVWLEGVHVGVK